ncbi:MAG: hypothetical protein PWQ58_240 [Archaeoglobaceae archaeon]|nr:hypothetical protein [Archaeoglobaceae archaeon]
MPKVLVESLESYREVRKFVDRVYDVFGFEKCLYLKPNFLKFDDPGNGCITHPEVVKAIVCCAKEHGLDMVVIEGGFYRDSAEKCFKAFDLRSYAECINLNEDEFLEVEINGKALKSVQIARTAIKARNNFLSVPKMKVHHLTKVTLGIKNSMGFLKKPALYMHPKISQKLVDLLHYTKPSLTIVDGIIGGSNSEMDTKPVKHGVMVASNNVIACDFVSAGLMGFDPNEIAHIRLAMESFGLSAEDIEIEGKFGEKKNYSLSLLSKILGRLGI